MIGRCSLGHLNNLLLVQGKVTATLLSSMMEYNAGMCMLVIYFLVALLLCTPGLWVRFPPTAQRGANIFTLCLFASSMFLCLVSFTGWTWQNGSSITPGTQAMILILYHSALAADLGFQVVFTILLHHSLMSRASRRRVL